MKQFNWLSNVQKWKEYELNHTTLNDKKDLMKVSKTPKIACPKNFTFSEILTKTQAQISQWKGSGKIFIGFFKNINSSHLVCTSKDGHVIEIKTVIGPQYSGPLPENMHVMPNNFGVEQHQEQLKNNVYHL